MTSRRAIRRANRRGRPNRVCTGIVELAVLALPAGELRHRWEREMIAEMYGLSLRRQATYSLMTLVTAGSLRSSATRVAPGGTMIIVKPRKPLLCLLNLHHRWRRESTEDGSRYLTCAKCGKDKYVGSPVPGTGVAGG